MEKYWKKINKLKNGTKKLVTGMLAIILLILLLILILKLNGINIINGPIGANRKALAKTKSIAEYEIMGTDNITNELETLVTIENEKGIKTIQIEDLTINANGKEKISFDRKLAENSTTNIEIELVNGEEEKAIEALDNYLRKSKKE